MKAVYPHDNSLIRRSLLATALVLCASTDIVLAQQDGRPRPSEATSQASPAGETAPPTTAPSDSTERPRPNPTTTAPASTHRNGNSTPARSATGVERPAQEGMVQLGFNGVKVDELIPFIVKATGKVVIPVNLAQLAAPNKTITLINDKPIPRSAALDLIINALRLNGVGVIEKEDVIILDTVENILQTAQMPVIPADEDIMTRQDKGLMVIKIFRLKEALAQTVVDHLQETQV